MNSALGRMEDLPRDYLQRLQQLNLLPLWPALRSALPYGMPSRSTQPCCWPYAELRPQLLRAGELTPIEKAERRVLVLCNPGLGADQLKATPSIYIGMQLILPGETAPNHQHTPSAVRFVVEGSGGYTLVRGEKLPMEKGDLILTPPGLWHQHGHEGDGPVIWLDALDLPLILGLEASYCSEGAAQSIEDEHNAAQARYGQGGIVPYATLERRRQDYPLLRFPWREVRRTLCAMAASAKRDERVHVAYVNPENGEECLKTLGFSALMLRPGEEVALPRRSASAVLHVVEGGGTACIDAVELAYGEADTLAVPTHAQLALRNASAREPAFLFMVDDAPLQRKLGIYHVYA